MEQEIEEGEIVIKTEGHDFRGVVIAKFHTLSGKLRYVVECTVPGAAGIVHIFAPRQIKPTGAGRI